MRSRCFPRYRHPFQPDCKEVKEQFNAINKHNGAEMSVAEVTMRNHLAEARDFFLRIPDNRRREFDYVNDTCRQSPATPSQLG